MMGPWIVRTSIARLRENERELHAVTCRPVWRARGEARAIIPLRHGAKPCLARARGEARARGDTDIMIEIDPDAPVGVYEYVRIKEYIASLFEGRIERV